MSRNYRVMKTNDGYEGTPSYAIHEVYYYEDTVHASTVHPVDVVGTHPVDVVGKDLKELHWILKEMTECLEKPALEYDKETNTYKEVEIIVEVKDDDCP